MFSISILMCGARNGGSVMSTRLWCSYMVESAVVLGEKGRQDAFEKHSRKPFKKHSRTSYNLHKYGLAKLTGFEVKLF